MTLADQIETNRQSNSDGERGYLSSYPKYSYTSYNFKQAQAFFKEQGLNLFYLLNTSHQYNAYNGMNNIRLYII